MFLLETEKGIRTTIEALSLNFMGLDVRFGFLPGLIMLLFLLYVHAILNLY